MAEKDDAFDKVMDYTRGKGKQFKKDKKERDAKDRATEKTRKKARKLGLDNVIDSGMFD